MDPRQRLLLQEGWNVLEDAGLGAEDLRRQRVGMFVGVEEGDYPGRAATGSIVANHTGILAARLAYFLDLRGPVMAINTSCSSAAVALHQACLSLRQGECDVAVVAGVNLLLAPENLGAMAEAGMLSSTGTCLAFDRRANGMTPGEAVVAVALKPLREAAADGDPIDAVILASGINYDGKTNGITAPNGVTQAELVRAVQARAGVRPEQIDYIVTHGTGTRLGDPVEVNALMEAFGGSPSGNGHPCALTSCKTNLGHTFAASGLVSLVALVEALRHETIPASLHFQEGNEFIRWEHGPFHVNTRNRPWPASPGQARIGAVSAFGMSGTNAHFIVGDHTPPPAQPGASGRMHPLVWSAKTPEALRERVDRFVQAVRQGAVREEHLPAVSQTLTTGRHHFAHRRAVVAGSLAEAVDLLANPAEHPNSFAGTAPTRAGRTLPTPSGASSAPAAPTLADAGSEADRLRQAARAWCQGEDVDWAALAAPAPRQRIHLPTYAFARREFWLEPNASVAGGNGASSRITGAPPTQSPRRDSDPANTFQRLQRTANHEMDRRLEVLLSVTLKSLGLLSANERLAQAGEAPGYLERWLDESRRLLAEANDKLPLDVTLESAWEEWERAKAGWMADATLRAEATLVERCLRALPGILRGDVRPVDAMFPNASVEYVEAVYRNHPVADVFNRVATHAATTDAVARLLGRNPGRGLRILEIGAGTGGTTSSVLEALQPYRTQLEEYTYTDLSKAFLLHAEERFAPRHPYLRTRLFDVSRPPEGQRLEIGSYDIVLAANVLHATPDIRASIRHAAAALRPGGVLVLNELSANGWFTHLTFGLLEGWWLYRDEALRLRGCPGLAPDTWAALLAEEGFASIQFPAAAGHPLGQQIVVAEWVGTSSRRASGGDRGPGVAASCPVHLGDGTNPAARGISAAQPDAAKAGATPAPLDPSQRRLAIDYFKRLVASGLKMGEEEIDPSAPLETYGMDSLMIGKVVAKLREAFADVPSSLLFEIQTVAELADHFLAERRAETLARLGVADEPAPAFHAATARPPATPAVSKHACRPADAPDSTREPIAIVGMSGRFPSAPNLRTFWENLSAGRDCIVEIPAERWSLDGFFEPDMETAIETGKSYCRWGGFLEGFANFDPLFFNLSPRLALEMDPQERIFVQAAWEVLEDAGYTRESLAEKHDGRVGVFAGVAHTEFNVLGPDLWREGQQLYPRTSFGSVANRVSFLLNLRGPSIPVDTMCSSALTAIHLARESILRGECDVAIAGASNLCLHPSTYVALCASRLLSKGAKCHSFGEGDDGYVPAEGVGLVFLKRLSEAVRDRDHIHAIVRGTAVNHGGRTNGYTVPNPNAQARVIRQALDDAGVNARTVTYVETHGAGTKLGDPIEVVGLTRAFRHDTADTNFCSIGSVKSNVGHVEAAAGMAGLAKVVLQMQHGQLVPSLHSQVLNPEIRFEETPFHVQQKLEPWRRPSLMLNGASVTFPRLAGVSAFGAGGANAHVILEEYEDARTPGDRSKGPCLIVLSARGEDRLREAAERLRAHLAENPDLRLEDVAYTLQVGREAMEERLAFTAETLDGVVERLDAFLAKTPGSYLRGRVKPGQKTADAFLDPGDWAELARKWLANGDLTKALEGWVRGYRLDWRQLYPGTPPRRVVLPTYPFAQERYWFTAPPVASPAADAMAASSRQNGEASWLCFREAWAPQPLSGPKDRRAELAAFAGRAIAVAGADAGELRAMVVYLRQLEAEADLPRPLKLSILDPDQEGKDAEPPEVVLFLGPRRVAGAAFEPDESELSTVFRVSQQLMRAHCDEPIALYYLYGSDERHRRLDCEALAGFFRAAMKENEQHAWTLIGDYETRSERERFDTLIDEWLRGPAAGAEVRYERDSRAVRQLAETTVQPGASTPFRQGGVYLLAGGFGYLGQQISLELARRCQPTLVLITRGSLDESRQAHCRRLESLGAKVMHASVDIADREQLRAVYRDIARRTGPVHGVFHLARHHEDRMIARKPWESFARVIRPKVHGMLNLDEITRGEPLDFFAVFSSLGAYGVRGASDYSYATTFQNAFSELRNRWVAEGARLGTTVAMCWGPWVEDHLFPESRPRLVQAGFDLIETGSGFPLMEAVLADRRSPLGLVRVHDAPRIRELFGLTPDAGASAPAAPPETLDGLLANWERRHATGEEVTEEVAARIGEDDLRQLPDPMVQRVYRLLFGGNGDRGGNGNGHRPESMVKPAAEPPGGNGTHGTNGNGTEEVATVVRACLAEVLHLSKIDDERSFVEYGLDSIGGMQLAVRLEKRLKREVSPQSLLGFPTVADLSRHLATESPS